MNEQFDQFQRRVGRIDQAYSRRVSGSFTLRSDGLLVPKMRSRLRFHFPWRAVVAGFVATMLVKGFLIFFLTTEGYEARMATMLEGSEYQEIAATILAPDPVSAWAAARMADIAYVLTNL